MAQARKLAKKKPTKRNPRSNPTAPVFPTREEVSPTCLLEHGWRGPRYIVRIVWSVPSDEEAVKPLLSTYAPALKAAGATVKLVGKGADAKVVFFAAKRTAPTRRQLDEAIEMCKTGFLPRAQPPTATGIAVPPSVPRLICPCGTRATFGAETSLFYEFLCSCGRKYGRVIRDGILDPTWVPVGLSTLIPDDPAGISVLL